MERVFHTLEPWFDSHSQVLILGTMPSPRSRELHCYYGHPQNRFWKTLSAVFGEDIPQDTTSRRDFVLRHHIALWDVLQSCEIQGAEDASISKEIPNDLSCVLNASPIRTIFTTGVKAKSLYDRLLLPTCGIEAIGLPSTSPANRRWGTEAQLIDAYSVLLAYL